MQARVRTWCRGGKEVKYERGETLLLVEKTDNDCWKVRYIYTLKVSPIFLLVYSVYKFVNEEE